MTELAMYDSSSPVSGFRRLKRSSLSTSSTMPSISRVTRLVSSMSVPMGLVMKMFKYCGSLLGKNSTLGGNTPRSANATTIKLAVPKKKNQGRRLAKANRKNRS